jgi:ABC-type transport system involved in cytochrome bd biosynthesis fused ATPase/permease subunit
MLRELAPLPTLREPSSNAPASDVPRATPSSSSGVYAVRASVSWPNGRVLCKDANFCCEDASLTVLVGSTGCGKTGLLRALLGDLVPDRGVLFVDGSISYVAQTPWIRNASIRANILFHRPFKQVWYEKVLTACALGPDLEVLPHGDATEIGERGINLSGGQKQRVALARAVYNDADCYLLDDPLSAVDSHVAQHILHRCLRELLAHKCVLLVTHNLQLVEYAQQVLWMDQSSHSLRFVGAPQAFKDCYSAATGHSFVQTGQEAVGNDNQTPQRKESDVGEQCKDSEDTMFVCSPGVLASVSPQKGMRIDYFKFDNI